MLARFIMDKKIQGWYYNTVVSNETLKKMLKLIIIAEQWPYHFSWIFYQLEKMRKSLLPLEKTDELQKKSASWIKYYNRNNIIDIIFLISKDILYHKKLQHLLLLDYDVVLFTQFCKEKPFITINTIYLLIPFLFNLNSSIKDKIAEIDHLYTYTKIE